MDVNRSWRCHSYFEYRCGPYVVYQHIDDPTWKIYLERTFSTDLLATVATVTAAKRWLKDNWHRLEGKQLSRERDTDALSNHDSSAPGLRKRRAKS